MSLIDRSVPQPRLQSSGLTERPLAILEIGQIQDVSHPAIVAPDIKLLLIWIGEMKMGVTIPPVESLEDFQIEIRPRLCGRWNKLQPIRLGIPEKGSELFAVHLVIHIVVYFDRSAGQRAVTDFERFYVGVVFGELDRPAQPSNGPSVHRSRFALVFAGFSRLEKNGLVAIKLQGPMAGVRFDIDLSEIMFDLVCLFAHGSVLH